MLKTFDTRTYSISDFLEWRDRGQLNLSPDFQRRSVWTEKAKSYLVDTVLRGKPMPKLILTQELKNKKAMRVVVDGQQRLRALLEFIDGHFKVSRAHNREFAGKDFDLLGSEVQKEFLQYELGVDLLYDTPYRELLDIFARINTYTVKLNNQENLNAKYLGFFKQAAFDLGFQYAKYFTSAGILTKAQVSRMAEAELSSDLLVALISGVQTNKNVEQFYRRYEDDPGPIDPSVDRYHQVMSALGDIYAPDELKNTNWSRKHLFYSLFCSVGNFLFGVEGLEPIQSSALNRNEIGRLRNRLDDFSARYDEYTDKNFDGAVPEGFERFIEFSRRGTTDTGARVYRSNFICKYAS